MWDNAAHTAPGGLTRAAGASMLRPQQDAATGAGQSAGAGGRPAGAGARRGGSMEFGLFSNGHRRSRVAAQTYDEDLFEVVTADRCDFHEAWISEHIGLNRPDTLPAPELFICKAAALTKRIHLGPAVRLLPLYHPIDVATTAAVCDHLTDGRYMFGFGGGGLGLGNMEQRGTTDDL